MIRVNVSRADASVTETETLTAGRVGLECGFTFSTEWDGLAKVAVFEGAETIEVALGTASIAVVPPECMATAGYNLRVGVYGLSETEAVVIPTVWAKAGKIKDSANPENDSLAPATPELVAQITNTANSAIDIAREVQAKAENGEFDGEDGISPTASVSKSGTVATITVTDRNGTTTAEIHDGEQGGQGRQGPVFVPSVSDEGVISWTNDGDLVNPASKSIKGPQGDAFTYADFTPEQLAALKGADGVSPTITVTNITGGHVVTITDVNGTRSMNVMDGDDGATGPRGATGPAGADGYSPTVTVTNITGGHRVTITDANGAHTFDVMDGTGGGSDDIYLTDSLHMNVTELQAAYAANKAILVRYYDTNPQGWKWLYFTHYDSTSGEYHFCDLTQVDTDISYHNSGSGDVWYEAPIYSSYEDLWDLPEINGVELIGNKTPAQLGLVASDQGTANAGKFLVIGSDGIVAPVTMQTWQGGSF